MFLKPSPTLSTSSAVGIDSCEAPEGSRQAIELTGNYPREQGQFGPKYPEELAILVYAERDAPRKLVRS